ncbi:MAG: CHASE4 domain-containing protein, partial [Geminicoccales bacterium]
MTAARCPTAPYPTYRFGWQVAVPVLTLLAAAMLAVVAFVSYSAARQGQNALAQSTQATRGAIGMKVQEVARTAQDYAWWNDAVDHLDLDFDLAWADSNVGRYIHDTFGYDVTFLVGRDDRTRYATFEGERRT